jgi:hypothetical protein
MTLKKAEILELVGGYNTRETARRREYYDGLVARGDKSETFEQHLEKYSDLIRTGDTATAAEIEKLSALVKRPLPAELVEFYTQIGKLRGREEGIGIRVEPVKELLRRTGDPSLAPYERYRSLGLADMMRACWGNDRFEFDPKNGEISAAELQAINEKYTCIGWVESDLGVEAHTYAYFDAEGRFGTVFYHQDAFDELYEHAFIPMLQKSSARSTLSDVLLEWLRNDTVDEE